MTVECVKSAIYALRDAMLKTCTIRITVL